MKSIAASWLAEQCGMLPGIAGGVLLLGEAGGDPPREVARWPQGPGAPAGLVAAATAALTGGQAVAEARPPAAGAPRGSVRIAVPIVTPARQRGAVAIEMIDAKPSEAGIWIERLRAGSAWLEVLLRRNAPRDRIGGIVELVGIALEPPHFRAAASAAATELAARLDCDRVSVGFLHRGQARVEALSHSARFDARANLIRALEAAMDEACDQDATLVHPPPPGSPPKIVREHELLARHHSSSAVCTVPLASGGRIVGAMTFERAAGKPFEPGAIQRCEDAAALLGPVFELKRTADQRLPERVRELLRARLGHLVGPEHPGAKLGTALGLALVLFLAVAQGTHRVTAEATLEGRVQRAIVAGIDGYITQVNARPGDVVRRGAVLGRLDERDLQVEHRKWASRREQLRKEHREALAAHDRAQVSILGARMAQAEAQIELLEGNLARTRLQAPFDGIVVRGDLSQSLGSPVSRGDVLFEMAPLEGYRVILRVDEREISYVAEAQPGRLTLSAMPGVSLPFTVERVTPVASASEGRNAFRVEARVEEASASLRPGMEGVAKIEVGRRRLLWIWTHGLVDWLRLRVWSWWP